MLSAVQEAPKGESLSPVPNAVNWGVIAIPICLTIFLYIVLDWRVISWLAGLNRHFNSDPMPRISREGLRRSQLAFVVAGVLLTLGMLGLEFGVAGPR